MQRTSADFLSRSAFLVVLTLPWVDVLDTLSLLATGVSLTDIATSRSIRVTTIINHVTEASLALADHHTRRDRYLRF